MMKESEQNKITDSALRWGLLSALVASLCCVGPLALILLGVGGASTALSIGYRKPYFIILGVIILGFGFYKLYQKNCETKHLNRKQQIAIFGGSFLAAALLYYLLTFVIAPLIAPWVYQFRFGG